jgi:hypothetical protein
MTPENPATASRPASLRPRRLSRDRRSARGLTCCRMSGVVIVAVAVSSLAVAIWCTTPASAAPPAKPWHTCTRMATRLIGSLEYHNDHFTGAPGPSCITVRGGRVTINTCYRPHAGSVVAYDAIQFGDYPWVRDPAYGLPAQVGHRMPVLHVTARLASARRRRCLRRKWLFDADIWFSRNGAAGPLHHIREMIIANRWHGYRPYDARRLVKIGKRSWWAGAEMTGRRGHKWLLIRFFGRHPGPRAVVRLGGFLRIARHHHWITDAMTVDSVSYAPECWRGCRGLSYSMHVSR